MNLTAHQTAALKYIADNSFGGAYMVDVKREEVGARTAGALERLGLIRTNAERGTHSVKIGGFCGYAGHKTVAFTDLRAELTAAGLAVLA